MALVRFHYADCAAFVDRMLTVAAIEILTHDASMYSKCKANHVQK